MSSSSQLVANQANGRKSTGPRTPRGKAIAARNALRHGLFARQLLLGGESADELTTLKTDLLRRLNPRDALELELVERVVNATWKLRRLQRFEAALFAQESLAWEAEHDADDRENRGLGRREPVPAEVVWQDASDAFRAQLERLAAQEQRLENAMRRSLRELALLQKADVSPALTDFAADRIDRETQAVENWRNEANRSHALKRTADVSTVQDEREQKAADRADHKRWRKTLGNLAPRMPGSRTAKKKDAPSPAKPPADESPNRENEANSTATQDPQKPPKAA